MKIAAVILLIFFCTLDSALAAQAGTVITDGAMVYKEKDFDSAVVGYMRVGQKVRVSTKKFGPFYRIQFKQGVIAYISDVDVQTDGSDSSMPTSKKSKSGTETKSFISKTYLGLSYGMLNYSEVFNQRNESESLKFWGLKFTMPMKYLSGPFVFDTSLLYHSGCPSYYNMPSLPSQGQSGKVIIYDAQVLYSLAEGSKRTIWAYVGGGLGLNYSSFVVEINGSKKDISDMVVGGVLTGGIAFQSGKIAVKIEPKYYVMKSSYLAIMGSIQYEF